MSSGVRTRKHCVTTGWRPTCSHNAAVVPCTVCDPFLGSGTTAAVAQRLGLRCIGIELSEPYCRMAEKRFRQRSLLAKE
jgi:tRNA G10  N-methylase Trm11